MTDVDVLVVGAGPAGSTAARDLAGAGHRVLLIEEHPRVGVPVQCAGLVSQRVLDLAGPGSYVRRPVRGANVFGPSLREFSFRADEPRAFVIDRAGLDVHLGDRAAAAGAEVRTSTRFDGVVRKEPDGVTVRTTDPDGNAARLSARVVVGADGVASAVARAFRLRRPVEILPAFEAEYPESPGDADAVEVYLGRRFAPGLFGWWIPDGAGGARVGIACDADGTSARVYFHRLIEHLVTRFGRPLVNPTAFLVSGIPIGTVPALSGDRVVLVGDAAAQVKPLSGGGIFTGMRAAEIAAKAIDGALRSGELSAARLKSYDTAWRAEFSEEFRKALYLRRLFARLSDAELDSLIDALGRGSLGGTVVAFGDIDFPTSVARELLRESPGLMRLLPKAIGAWVSSAGAYPTPELEPGPRLE
ncbi:MAG: NAD(P)/FAD-dependent oxidoreductase [Thermoplasmata archaeon]